MPHLLPAKSLLLFLGLSCLICKMGRQLFTSTKIPSKGVDQLMSRITIFPFRVKHTILWDLNENSRYTFTKHLPRARLFARCSTPGPMESTHPPEKAGALIVPFFRWGNWGLESCSALRKAMHHISGRSKIWTYVCLTWNPTFLTFLHQRKLRHQKAKRGNLLSNNSVGGNIWYQLLYKFVIISNIFYKYITKNIYYMRCERWEQCLA